MKLLRLLLVAGCMMGLSTTALADDDDDRVSLEGTFRHVAALDVTHKVEFLPDGIMYIERTATNMFYGDLEGASAGVHIYYYNYIEGFADVTADVTFSGTIFGLPLVISGDKYRYADTVAVTVEGWDRGFITRGKKDKQILTMMTFSSGTRDDTTGDWYGDYTGWIDEDFLEDLEEEEDDDDDD